MNPPASKAGPIAGLALALPLGLLPLLMPASLWTLLPLLLALPLHLAGAAWALGYRAERGPLVLIRARAGIVLLLLLAAAALLTALLAWPLMQLREAASLTASLLASVAVAAGGLAIWRYWPAVLLPVIEPVKGRRRPSLTTALQAGRALAQTDPSAGRGLLATVLLLVLLLGALGLGLLDERLASTWRLLVLPLWSLLIAPFCSVVLIALVEPARLAANSVGSRLPMAANGAAEPPMPLPVGLDATTRLYAVARNGRVELALAELEMGAQPHALPDPGQRDQRTLAMLAAVLSDLRLLRALITRGVDVNRRHAGLTPLLAATRDSLHGRPEAVMTLLANGADARATDAEGRTPLHFAALLADPEVAALLLDANAEIDACNRDGYSALGVACASGNWRMARFLLDRKAKPEPAGGQPAVMAAVAGDDDDVAGLQLLIKFKASVNARGRLGRTALMKACLAGHQQLVDALLNAGADIDARDEHAVTALLEAARAGATAVLQRLALASPDVSACDQVGRNALALACQSAHSTAATIATLLRMGVDPMHVAEDGRRAIDIAVASGRWPLVALLDPSYALPSTLDHGAAETVVSDASEVVVIDPRPWREQLHAALLDNASTEVDALLRANVDRSVCGELFDAFGPGLPSSLRARLAGQLEVHGADEISSQHLWRCVDAADGIGIDLLLERAATVGGRAGLARYLSACLAADDRSAMSESRARAMLASGADGFAACEGTLQDGEVPVTLSIRLGWLHLLQDLLTCGANPHALDARGESALMVATGRRCTAALPLLLRHGAQPDASTADGRTARGTALAQGHAGAIDWLDWAGWRLPGRPLREADLVAAAASGDRAAVRRLIALGLPVDGLDVQGATALLRACGSGHAELVADLLGHGADPARAASSGATCLSAAVSRRQLTVIAVLLRHGVAADQPLPGDITPLMVAAALGFPDVCRVLLEAGANAQAVDQRGATALHALAQFGFSVRERTRVLSTWELLLEAGALADARNAEGLTPLLLLLGSRMEPGANPDEECLNAQVERLLRTEPDLTARDGRGFAPLHLAALHGQLRLVRRLLAAGADREARDALNRRPQDIAVMRGFVDIARELEPIASAAPPSFARLLRDPSQ
ncbi:MAG: ankyrin repeat domain-containing protein [Pseudomarimonas sp.]